MGAVYLAHDVSGDVPVAIKLMSKGLHSPDLQRRFMTETEILGGLNHPNIVRCYEVIRSIDGIPSVVMEYLDGVDLRSFEGKPFPELLPLLIQVIRGMRYLRQQGIYHRDLSSNNILVALENQKRVAKIVDFGVAKIVRESAGSGDPEGVTQQGSFLGKFSYAAPEFFFGEPVDWRCDLYSLGVVFHRLLTGRAPLEVASRKSFALWLEAHRTPPELVVSAPDGLPPLPPAVSGLVVRMLGRKPSQRPQSYDEILIVLETAQREATRGGLEPDTLEISTLPPARDPSNPSAQTPRSDSAGIRAVLPPPVPPSGGFVAPPPPPPKRGFVAPPPTPLPFVAPAPQPEDEGKTPLAGSIFTQTTEVEPVLAEGEPAPAGQKTEQLGQVIDRLRREGKLDAKGRPTVRAVQAGNVVYGHGSTPVVGAISPEPGRRASSDPPFRSEPAISPVPTRPAAAGIVLAVLGCILILGLAAWLLFQAAKHAGILRAGTSAPSKSICCTTECGEAGT